MFLVNEGLVGFGDAGRANPGCAVAADAGFAGFDVEFFGVELGEEGAGGVVVVGVRVGVGGLAAVLLLLRGGRGVGGSGWVWWAMGGPQGGVLECISMAMLLV